MGEWGSGRAGEWENGRVECSKLLREVREWSFRRCFGYERCRRLKDQERKQIFMEKVVSRLRKKKSDKFSNVVDKFKIRKRWKLGRDSQKILRNDSTVTA